MYRTIGRFNALRSMLAPNYCSAALLEHSNRFQSTLTGHVKPSTKVEIVQDQFNLPILSPSLKELKTRKIRLENGIQAYLISDPSSPQCAGALSGFNQPLSFFFFLLLPFDFD
mgnify:CR=1 FL=1